MTLNFTGTRHDIIGMRELPKLVPGIKELPKLVPSIKELPKLVLE
jgi:hypothetical protein